MNSGDAGCLPLADREPRHTNAAAQLGAADHLDCLGGSLQHFGWEGLGHAKSVVTLHSSINTEFHRVERGYTPQFHAMEFMLWAPMMVAELMQEQIRVGCNQVIDALGARGVELRTAEALRPTACDVLVSLAESIATVRLHSDAPASQNIALSLPQLRELARMLNAAADQIEATTTPRQ